MLKNPSAQEVWRTARKNGSESMYEDGLRKVEKGITTLDEVRRVAALPSE